MTAIRSQDLYVGEWDEMVSDAMNRVSYLNPQIHWEVQSCQFS